MSQNVDTGTPVDTVYDDNLDIAIIFFARIIFPYKIGYYDIDYR